MAGKPPRRNSKDAPVTIVIHRDEGEEAPHHGGAWKVAYADFVTAMMAFFLLMWLLNATTEEQRTGLADYFAPTNLFGRSASGSGQPFGGKTANDTGTSVSSDGSPQTVMGKRPPQQDVEEDDTEVPAQPLKFSSDSSNKLQDDARQSLAGQGAGQTQLKLAKPGPDRQPLVQGGDYAAARLTPSPTPTDTEPTAADAIVDDTQREKNALEQAGAQLMEAIRHDPALQDAAGQLMIENVPEGLRIQVVDAEHRSMFALGSSTPTQRVRELMEKVVPVLAGLPNSISISGHTDSLSFRGQEKDNWQLSAERANATRRILEEAGLADERIRSVTGNADRDLLVPADPLSPTNRRITIIVLRHAGGGAHISTPEAPTAPAPTAATLARP